MSSCKYVLKVLMLTFLFLGFQAVNAESLTGYWAQHERAIIFDVDDSGDKPVVKKVYAYTQGKPYCMLDKSNTRSMQTYFSDAIIDRTGDNSLSMRRFKTGFPMTMHKIDHLPDACINYLTTSDPKTNFDVLWQFFNEYYANFKERLGTREKWESLGRHYKSMIDKNTNDERLFDVMGQLLNELHDTHIDLFYENDRDHDLNIEEDLNARQDKKAFDDAYLQSYKLKDGTVKYYEQLGKSFIRNFHTIDTQYLNEVFQGEERSLTSIGFPRQPVYTWGMLKQNPNVGYVRILQELHFDLNLMKSTPEHYRQAVATIDKFMQFFKEHNVKALIIDARLNFGGDDAIDNYLVQYLLTQERVMLQTQPTINGQAQTTYKYSLHPNENPLRTKDNLFPVYVLTSNYTSSSGEILTMEIRTLANGKSVGYTTDGIFADTHTRELPNGWVFQMPFNKNTSGDGTFYGKVGIPADISFPPSNNYLMKKYNDANNDIILDKLVNEIIH